MSEIDILRDKLSKMRKSLDVLDDQRAELIYQIGLVEIKVKELDKPVEANPPGWDFAPTDNNVLPYPDDLIVPTRVDPRVKIKKIRNTFKAPKGYQYNDGGRALSGYRGHTRDCVARSIAIATGKPYKQVYKAINKISSDQGYGNRARLGVYDETIFPYLKSLGWEYHRLSGDRFKGSNLGETKFPRGKVIVALSTHYCALINHVLNDTFDPRHSKKQGTVRGYWTKKR